MLVRKKMSSRKKVTLIIFFILCLGVIVYLLFTTFFADKILLPKIGIDKTEEIEIQMIPKLNITFVDDFLDKSSYINLKTAVQLPIKADRVGRKNPFEDLPYKALEF